MKLSDVQISSHIISYNTSKCLILKRFDRRIVTIFVASFQTGVQSQKLWAQLHPCSNTEPPLLKASDFR